MGIENETDVRLAALFVTMAFLVGAFAPRRSSTQ
jgi:hypothetical protein